MNSTIARADRTSSLYWHFAPTVLVLGYPWYLAKFNEAIGSHNTAGALFANVCRGFYDIRDIQTHDSGGRFILISSITSFRSSADEIATVNHFPSGYARASS